MKLNERDIDEYLKPERAERITEIGRGKLKISGDPSVLKKFLYPQHVAKASLNDHVSDMFYSLSR